MDSSKQLLARILSLTRQQQELVYAHTCQCRECRATGGREYAFYDWSERWRIGCVSFGIGCRLVTQDVLYGRYAPRHTLLLEAAAKHVDTMDMLHLWRPDVFSHYILQVDANSALFAGVGRILDCIDVEDTGFLAAEKATVAVCALSAISLSYGLHRPYAAADLLMVDSVVEQRVGARFRQLMDRVRLNEQTNGDFRYLTRVLGDVVGEHLARIKARLWRPTGELVRRMMQRDFQ